ncbi:hypothetical protein bcgnr5369_68710 [Bacillus cereus]
MEQNRGEFGAQEYTKMLTISQQLGYNDRAIKVYKRMGFVEEGRQRKQIKYEDGSYGDDVLMGFYIE